MQLRFLPRTSYNSKFSKTHRIALKPILAPLLAVFACAQLAQGAATLPTYDGINYSVGYDLGTQSDTNSNTGIFTWTHIGVVAGRTRTVNVGSANLIYGGLANSVGNSV